MLSNQFHLLERIHRMKWLRQCQLVVTRWYILSCHSVVETCGNHIHIIQDWMGLFGRLEDWISLSPFLTAHAETCDIFKSGFVKHDNTWVTNLYCGGHTLHTLIYNHSTVMVSHLLIILHMVLILLLLTMLNTLLFLTRVFAPLGTMMWHHRGTGGAATPIRDAQLCGVREPSMP